MAKNNKTRFFCVLFSDKTWVFDQSERAQGLIYIIKYYTVKLGDICSWLSVSHVKLQGKLNLSALSLTIKS